MTTDRAIEVSGLVKRYGRLVAVDDLTFSIEPGEVFALLGPNGAGKTTTVEILEGFRRSDAGEVRVLGHDPEARDLRRRIGVMPQDGGLYAGIRPSEALGLFASFYPDPEAPERLLGRLGLDRVAATPYRRLSGGERQRLSLAIALVGRPELAFLDEPTAGMDVHGRTTTWDVIGELKERGTTVLLTTHVLEEAERLADRVAIVHRGRLVALGPPRELARDAAGGEIRFRTTPAVDTTALGERIGSPVARTSGGYHVPGAPATPELIARLAAALADQDVLVVELTVGRRSLEEVFVELTRDEEP